VQLRNLGLLIKLWDLPRERCILSGALERSPANQDSLGNALEPGKFLLFTGKSPKDRQLQAVLVTRELQDLKGAGAEKSASACAVEM